MDITYITQGECLSAKLTGLERTFVMLTYEVVVYNEQVRAKVRDGDHHRTFSDDWGDSHYLEIKADDEDAAKLKVRTKYPVEDGFVIEGISMM